MTSFGGNRLEDVLYWKLKYPIFLTSIQAYQHTKRNPEIGEDKLLWNQSLQKRSINENKIHFPVEHIRSFRAQTMQLQ